jgi:hypothetical protein
MFRLEHHRRIDLDKALKRLQQREGWLERAVRRWR